MTSRTSDRDSERLSPEQFEAVEKLFEALVASGADARESALADVDDEVVVHQVRALLRAHDSAEGGDATRSIVERAQSGAASALQDSESPAGWIGRYRVIEEIGRGGMGTVFVAEQREPIRRMVALKLIKLGMDTQEIIARFESERQALALMNHPAIAQVLDAGATESGRPYFVMELVRGSDLLSYADAHTMSVDDRLRLFMRVCEGVQHAHQKGVIHRDLKPSNILVTEVNGEAVPKIIDFGVAKAIAHRLIDRTAFTEQGQIIGTPEYMSPEQAGQSAIDVDSRSDIYSLGVLLYELLVGDLPFDADAARAEGFESVLRRIRTASAPKPSTRCSELVDLQSIAGLRQCGASDLQRMLRGDLDWIVMRALEKDRNRRYASAVEFAQDIERHLEGLPVLAGPPSAAYRTRKFVRRHRVGVTAASAVALALVIGTIASSIQAYRATRAEQRAVRAMALAEQASEETEREAAISGAINEFLTGMLTSIQPSRARGREITVREVLDRAALDSGDQFSDLPDVEAAIRRTVGVTYFTIGVTDEARRQLESAVRAYEQEAIAQPRDLWQAYSTLGLLCLEEGDYAQAEERFIEARDLAATLDGEYGRGALATIEYNLGWLWFHTNQYERAEENVRRALAVRSELSGPENAETIRYEILLAQLHLRLGRFTDSQSRLERVLPLARRTLHPDDMVLANAIATQGWILSQSGRLQDAEPLYRESRDIYHRVVGPAHPDTLRADSYLAWLLSAIGKLGEALAVAQSAYETSVQELGDESPATFEALNSLAQIHRARGEFSEAASLYEDHLQITSKAHGDDSLKAVAIMNNLAGVYWSMRDSRCIDLWNRVLSIRTRELGDTHPDTLGAKMNVGLAESTMGDLRRAIVLFRDVADGQAANLGPTHQRTLQAKGNLASALAELGELHDALVIYEEIVPALVEQGGETSQLAVQNTLGWIGTLSKSERFAEAIALAEQFYLLVERDPQLATRRAEAHGFLGHALWKDGQLEKAEPMLLTQWKLLADASASVGDRRDAAQDLRDMYEAWGRDDQARQWEEELDRLQ